MNIRPIRFGALTCYPNPTPDRVDEIKGDNPRAEFFWGRNTGRPDEPMSFIVAIDEGDDPEQVVRNEYGFDEVVCG